MVLDWTDFIAPAVTAIIGTVTIVLVKIQFDKKFESDKKQHQVQGLLEAFKILDNEAHRKNRRVVFDAYFEYDENGKLEAFEKDEVATVMADFDIMGKLVDSGNIDRDQFLEEYGSLVYRCWRCLKLHVEKERDDREFPAFMTWFEWLGGQGYDYWKDERELERKNLNDTALFRPGDRSKKIYFRDIPKEKENEKENKSSPI